MALPKVLRITHSTDNTTIVNNDQIVTVKDIAINGILADLASARGQIGNSKTQGSHDFSSGMLSEKPGMYTAMNFGSTNVPFTGPFAEMILGTPTHRGSLLITYGRSSFPRAAISAIDMTEGGEFSGYNRLITEQQIGDGLTVNNGIISVPEYDGATASSSGTSGLVPPATAGQADYVLCGDGEWKDMLGMVAHAAGPSKKVISIPLTGTSTNYIAPETGYISYRAEPQDSNSWISLTIDGTSLYDVARPITANTNIALNLSISKGQKAILNCVENVTFTSRNAYFVYCNGNAPE